MEKNKKSEIPLYTKWGIRVTTIIILLLTAMIIKNCLDSFMYGVDTKQELQNQYYELGYSHGRQKAQGMKKEEEPETNNLLLKKLYHKGYRDGWDSAQHDSETQNLTRPSETEQK